MGETLFMPMLMLLSLDLCNMVPLPLLQLLLQMPLPLKMPLFQLKNVMPKLILKLMQMQNPGGTDITDILTDIMDITDITDTFMEPMDTHGTDIMVVSDAEMDMVLLFHVPMAVKKCSTNS